ncbi:MAG: SurA N-terminal domain-containing protein, partial [Hyphomicrobiales bacterium]|nr:SurA N-terminal domain-containing protein [Hyphomicrobiales bacterium]
MLETMRAVSQGVWGRLLLGVILVFTIASFAVWGIGPVFSGFGSGSLASVGSRTITPADYNFAYQNLLARAQQKLGKAIDGAQAHALGLDRQALDGLVSDAALDDEASRLGMAISDETIRKSIMSDPAFKGATGAFDANLFKAALQRANLSEAYFVAQQRDFYLRREVEAAVVQGLAPPRALTAALSDFAGATRAIDFYVVPKSAVPDPGEPSAKDLQAFYESRRALYAAPEYRSLVTLAVTPAILADPSKIDDAAARKLYDQVKAQRYSAPETRDLAQIKFPDEASAKAAKAKLDGGETFDALAAEMKLKPADVDLGSVRKDQVFDKAVADAAFALKAGEVSTPVKGAFGWFLVTARKIAPASVKPYEAVAADLKKEIATQDASAKVREVHDKIEAARTDGKSLTDAAKAAGLAVKIVPAIDAQGRDEAGVPVAGLVEASALTAAAFASDVGVDNDTVPTKDGGYVWFEVSKVTKAREKTLDEVKPLVLAQW